MMPSAMMPVPTAAAALSPPPPTTGVPATRPVAAAASALISALATGDSVTSGSQPRGMSKAASISSDQRRWPTSNNDVPDASETSL